MKKEKSFHISGKHSLAFTVYCETSKLFFTKIVNELVLFYQIPSLNSNEGISNTAHRAHTTNFPLSHTFSSSYKNTRLMISQEKKTVLQLEKLRRKAEGGGRRKYTRLNEKSKPSNCGTGIQLSLSAS